MCECEAVQRKRTEGLVCLHCKDNYCKSCCYVKDGDVSCSICLKHDPLEELSGSPPETCGDGYFEQWQDQHATVIGVVIGRESPWDITSYISTPETRAKQWSIAESLLNLSIKSHAEEPEEDLPTCQCLTEDVPADRLKICGECKIQFCEHCVCSKDGLIVCRLCLSVHPGIGRVDVTG